jgi:hypothetical protein
VALKTKRGANVVGLIYYLAASIAFLSMTVLQLELTLALLEPASSELQSRKVSLVRIYCASALKAQLEFDAAEKIAMTPRN